MKQAIHPAPVLAVAICGGPRCAGLHRLRGDACGGDLRAAVAERPDAVLVTVGCLGPCHLGGAAAVGRAVSGGGRLLWLGYPRLLTRLEIPDRGVALADWVRTTAPDAESLPAVLR